MAINYYDWTTSGTGTASATGTVCAVSDDTSTTTASAYFTGSCTSCGSTVTLYVPPPPERYLVKCPKGWTLDDAKAWVRLINAETRTGWLIDMLVTGDIVITDPRINVRTLADFFPLLKQFASAEDREKIDAFVAERGPLSEDS